MSRSSKSLTVLATVDGRAITDNDFEERLKPFLYKLRHGIYESEMRALDLMINQRLLEAEAKRRNTTPEAVYKAEVESKTKEPTDAEVTKFYETNKARIQGDLKTLRPDIINLLKNEQLNRLDAAFAQRLRSGARVQIFLNEPQPPVQVISTGNSPARGGDASAPVTIVEFTDFQCPSCAAMNPAVEDALKTYGNRVRLVARECAQGRRSRVRRQRAGQILRVHRYSLQEPIGSRRCIFEEVCERAGTRPRTLRRRAR